MHAAIAVDSESPRSCLSLSIRMNDGDVKTFDVRTATEHSVQRSDAALDRA